MYFWFVNLKCSLKKKKKILYISFLLSYLLAVGLECGRIIVYGWRPGGDRAGGQDWIRYGETDPSYPSARLLSISPSHIKSFRPPRSSAIQSSPCTRVHLRRFTFTMRRPTDKVTLWPSKGCAGGPARAGRGSRRSASGCSWPAPAPTTLSRSLTSTQRLFNATCCHPCVQIPITNHVFFSLFILTNKQNFFCMILCSQSTAEDAFHQTEGTLRGGCKFPPPKLGMNLRVR